MKVKRSLATLGEEAADPEAKTHRAESAAVAHPSLPGEVWARIAAFLPMSESAVARSLSKLPELCMKPEPTKAVINDRALLQQNWGNIIALILCSNTPVHEVMKANGFMDPRYLMSMIGIPEDTFEGREVGRYEHTDRNEIAAKLATYAEKFNVKAENIITAADIVEGKEVQDGDLVVLSYNDMLTHKATLDGKDIHLCVDVHADANGKLVFDDRNLPQGLKKLYFQNTQKDVTSIGNAFLLGCEGLAQLDLSPLSNVISIGNWFLGDCTGLSSVDLSPLRNLTRIERATLSGCVKLKEVKIPKGVRVLEDKTCHLTAKKIMVD